MSVLAVMKNLRSEVDAGSIRPYCFVEINGLKLASPENIYKVKLYLTLKLSVLIMMASHCCLVTPPVLEQVIYEALSGHRVGWKKALHLLNERFSEGKKIGKEDDKPCILLIDELDLLLTRSQSVTTFSSISWYTSFSDANVC